MIFPCKPRVSHHMKVSMHDRITAKDRARFNEWYGSEMAEHKPMPFDIRQILIKVASVHSHKVVAHKAKRECGCK